MPIYEYICGNCNNELEVLQKFSDEPLTVCPSCNEETLSKKTSMTAFHLKGGGWYKDGYSNGDAKSGNAKSASSGQNGNNTTTGKDSKPASTDSTKSSSDTSTSKAKETKPTSKAS